MLETIILKEQETDLAACKNISKYAILPAYYYFLKWKEKKKKQTLLLTQLLAGK